MKQVIVVRTDLNMRKGKIAAQAAHAAMMFLVSNNESERADKINLTLTPEETEWLTGSMTKIVVGIESEDALKNLILRAELKDVQVHQIIDAGKTEFNGVPTLTCAAFGPDKSSAIDEITGHLKLLLQKGLCVSGLNERFAKPSGVVKAIFHRFESYQSRYK